MLSAAAPSVRASDAPGCEAIGRGAFDVELGAAGELRRHASLAAGDTLAFTIEKPAGSFATLRLVTGTPRVLLAAPQGGTVSFVAKRRGAFEFAFAVEGDEGARLTANCIPSRRGQSARSPEKTPVARRAEKLLSEHPDLVELEAAGDLETAMVEADPSNLLERGRSPDPGPAMPRPQIGPEMLQLQPPSGVELYLEGGDKRYLLGKADGRERAGSNALTGGGVNYKLWPHIMVGALVKLDQAAADPGEPNDISYHGWLAGPVTTVQIAPGVSLDASAAWGAASDAGVAAGPELERRQVKARLAGTQAFGRWRFAPSIALDYLEEENPAMPLEESSGRSITGQLKVRPEISYRLDLGGASFIEPKAALSTVWGIGSLSELSPGALAHEDVHLKAEAGLTLGTRSGTKIQATGGLEDGGTGAPDIWSGRLQFNVPLK